MQVSKSHNNIRQSLTRFCLRMLCQTILLTGCLVFAACSTDSPSTATAAAPSHFDNPIIKYDTTDPTNQAGALIYTADPAAMVATRLPAPTVLMARSITSANPFAILPSTLR